MKRTTLLLNEDNLTAIKTLAVRQKRTMSSLIDEFLRVGIKTYKISTKSTKITLPSFSMGEACINIADRDALYDLMEKE